MTSEFGMPADFPHKTAANMAGLGFIGKSVLFISNEFGPRVRLATVLTDAPLNVGTMKPCCAGNAGPARMPARAVPSPDGCGPPPAAGRNWWTRNCARGT